MVSLRWAVSLAVLAVLVHSQEIKTGAELSGDQKAKMPDFSDMEVRKVLKCGICNAAVREFGHQIATAQFDAADRGYKMKGYDYVEIMDSVCTVKMDNYGLLLQKDGTPSADWSNEDRLFRARGGQITRLVKNTCSEVQDEYEEELKSDAPKLCSKGASIRQCRTTRLAKEICGDAGLKFCTKDRIADFQVVEDHYIRGDIPDDDFFDEGAGKQAADAQPAAPPAPEL